ncbi:MAG: L-rhamnose isomerase [Nitrososphaerota archaeon]|nr:L-rhamnose isomerase [Candidatus Bathyarchaeota archaeon]MDW8048832.1 L-rhamnose isomerase [Nitrososphaerota archaeon]
MMKSFKNIEKEISTKYSSLEKELTKRNIDIDEVKRKVSDFTVEVPSWVFGPFGGGRFSGYIPPGAARNIYEKFDDAAFIHKLTGATPRVSIHVGWDDPTQSPFDEISPESFKELKRYANKIGLEIGTVSPTYFLEGTHFGSLSNNDERVRIRLINHSLTAAEIAARYANNVLTLWFPDGSLYPGQVNMRTAQKNLRESLKKVYEMMPTSVKMLIEYKLFEPGTYHTVISDFGVACDLAEDLGERAGVIIDLGHHPHGVNVEHIVARLIDKEMLGGMHFNTRYAADDDHAVEPNIQLFRIFHELVSGGVIGNRDKGKDWTYVIDQCSALENRMHAVLHSVDSLMISYCKALTVDRETLEKYQKKNEIILSTRVLLDAFLTDVRPIIGMARLEKGLPLDPIEAYIESGYQEKIESERAPAKN